MLQQVYQNYIILKTVNTLLPLRNFATLKINTIKYLICKIFIYVSPLGYIKLDDKTGQESVEVPSFPLARNTVFLFNT